MKRLSPRRQQKGSALIIGLIIVLMLTLLGVTTLRTTVLEERMAGNQRDMNIAFQSAEAALREIASTNLTNHAYTTTVTGSATETGFGQRTGNFVDASSNTYSEFAYWTSVFNWSSSAATATQPSGTAAAPKYYVNMLPSIPSVWKAGQKTKRVYQITVNATGASTRAGAIVQGTTIQEN